MTDRSPISIEDNEKLHKALINETQKFQKYFLWLRQAMPERFHKDVKEKELSLIVHNLMNFDAQDYFSQIHLKETAVVLCLESADADLRILKHYAFYGIKDYSTYISVLPIPNGLENNYLRIAIISFTKAIESREVTYSPKRKDDLKNFIMNRNPALSDKELESLIDAMNTRFLEALSLENLSNALELVFRAQTTDDCQYQILKNERWQQTNSPSLQILLAWRNTPKHNFIYRLARVVFRHDLVIKQLNASYIHRYSNQSIFILALSLHGKDSKAAWDATSVTDFIQELVTLKYFSSFDEIDSVFIETKLLRGNIANLLRCMVNFIHQVLVNLDIHQYSIENIEEGLCRHPELTILLCNAFEVKFHPSEFDLKKFEELRSEFFQLVNQLDTGHEEHDIRRKNILTQAMNFVSFTLKTNFYRNNKTSLGFRLDPNYLNNVPFDRKKIFPELPFGIFFIKGMHFISYHIRFKDLARGGLRTVFPQKKEHMLVERNTVFNECYNLAYTQHKKNKDIPEGGAKAVIFLKPDQHLDSEAKILQQEMIRADFTKEEIEAKIKEFSKDQKKEYLYQTQRSFIKTLLSLINCQPDGTLKAQNIKDYWNKPEYIYLGPDENLHDSMIEWIADISKKYGYKPGGAFISGKPVIGINHKEFGVTSLGVNVYMHQVLEYLGIDPSKDPFTVKMTGGPDGDVAGNQIYNLYRFYPNTARLIALTDVSGTINDPHGLDLKECMTLFKEGKPINYYPHEKLSEGGFLLDRNIKKDITPYVQLTLCVRNKNGRIVEDWVTGNEMNALFRNNVHQTKADVFIPGGGRPKTLNESNINDFLDKLNEPTAKAIIEGANLYLSQWARRFLEDRGTLIIKDSSANKGGVICSSFEIICGLTLNDEEFLQNKMTLVKEILSIVESRARDEAALLLKTHQQSKAYLTDVSEKISETINQFTDQLLEYLEKICLSDPKHKPLLDIFINYCPTTLKQHYLDRLLKEIPENHQKAIIACSIASQLVYKKGVDWMPSVVDILPLYIVDSVQNFTF